MINNIVNQNEINFKDLENEIYALGCAVARETMQNFLQNVDKWLMDNRDKGVFRHKGYKKGCIKTIMGEVDYTRAVYEVLDGSTSQKHIYLLDEYMKFDCIGFISANLAERIADGACEASYAHTARNITELTGQSISQTTAWNIVQQIGKNIERQEIQCVDLNKEHKLQGTRETKVLFEEADGVFVKLQKKYRFKGHKTAEIKLALFHEGWKQTGSNRFELSEKTVVCGMDSSLAFNARKEAQIAKKYNVDEIEQRVFNSDGGQWIKSMYKDDVDVCFQLDRFHVMKAIRSNSPGGEFDKVVLKFLRQRKLDKMFEYIDAVANSLDSPETEEKVRKLYRYLYDNRNGLIPYQKRLENLPKLNNGLQYRTMGNCEHTVYLTVARRMKHRSAVWSPHGSLNLCKILCLKASHKLSESIRQVTTIQLPEQFAEETITKVFSASKIPYKVGAGYEGVHSRIPFENSSNSSARKLFQNLLGERSLGF